MRNYIIKTGVDVNKMTCFCLHAHCVRNKYPAVDCTILCVLNALGGFNFYSEGGVLPKITQYGFFDAIIAVTQLLSLSLEPIQPRQQRWYIILRGLVFSHGCVKRCYASVKLQL